MILSVLCIYHHYGFTWYHWFWSIWSLKNSRFCWYFELEKALVRRTTTNYPGSV